MTDQSLNHFWEGETHKTIELAAQILTAVPEFCGHVQDRIPSVLPSKIKSKKVPLVAFYEPPKRRHACGNLKIDIALFARAHTQP